MLQDHTRGNAAPNRRAAIFLAAAALGSTWLASVAYSDEAAATTGSPPNVLLIISDDQAWGDYGFMGHPTIRTPHLDRLASESLVFRRGYVPSSLCCPSLASIITGRYAHEHKISGNDPPTPAGSRRGSPEWTAAFRDGREVMSRHLEAVATLPRLLAERGYLSLQTGKWWQGDYRRGGFTHGMTRGERHGDAGLAIGRETMQPIYDFIATARTERRPFFVWYAPMLPHTPHNPPRRLFEKYRDQTASPHVARYWAMCEWFDETCGELLKHLDEVGVGDDTLVLYVTDNGWIQSEDNPRFAPRSKQSPYDGGLRTPIMVRWRGRVRPRMADDLASSIDLTPTVLEACGVAAPRGLPGVNLLDDSSVAKRKAVFGECFAHDIADLHDPAKSLLYRWVVHERWKLIEPARAGGSPELYDVVSDPTEQHNLAERRPETVERLYRLLNEWWDPQSRATP